MKRLFYLVSGVTLLYSILISALLISSCSKDSDSELIESILKEVPPQEASTLSVSATEFDFDAAGGDKTFTVSCNNAWHIIGCKDWCKVDVVSGYGNQTVTLTANVYSGLHGDDRNMNLIIGSGDKMQVLSVTQKNKDAIVLSRDKFAVPQEGGKVSVVVKSNITYEVTIPSEFQSWIDSIPDTRVVTTDSCDFMVSANESTDLRKGYIVFSGNSVTDTIYVYQAQKDRLLLMSDTCYVSHEGDEFTVELRTNINYDVRVPSSVSWLSLVETRALRTDRLHFSVSENSSREVREASVVVKDRNSDLSDTLYVHQYGRGLILSEREYSVPMAGETISVEVKGGIEYNVTIPSAFQSWITLVQGTSSSSSSAVTSKTYRFVVSGLEGSELLREGYIVFSGNSLTDTAYIAQLRSVYTETVSGIEFDMVYVEGGTFQMGATSEQGSDYDSDEKPIHWVTLSDYYIGKFEVTQGLWEKVMGTTIHDQRIKAGYSSTYGVGSDYPMYYVNWEEAQEFCTKLSQLTGKNYALPTEAQWEYAARGGVKSKGYKYSGSDDIDEVAWYTNNSGGSTHPVGTKQPNALGIYDMSGNVWEWCSDWYGPYSSESQSNPTGPSTGSIRVLRGGSWYINARYCRVSNRLDIIPDSRSYIRGFRVVLLP